MGAFKLKKMVNIHCQLSLRGWREYKISYFGHKISTFDYFYGGNLVKMGLHNRAKDKNAHFWGLEWKERLKWTRHTHVGKHYKLRNEVSCCNRGRKAVQINASFLEGVSGTSFGDTASRRILNTTNIIDPCHLCMQRQANKVNTSLKSLNERSMYQIKNKTGCWNAKFWQKDPSKVNDEGDTCYNNPMFKSDATSFQAGTMTVSILWENNTKHKLIVGLQVAYQLRCTAYMLRNKDKPVKCQLLLPTKRELYVSGRGTIHTNCTGNCMAARVWVTTNLIMTVFHTLSIINMLICLCTW